MAESHVNVCDPQLEKPFPAGCPGSRAEEEVTECFSVGVTCRPRHPRVRRVRLQKARKECSRKGNSTCRDPSFYRRGNWDQGHVIYSRSLAPSLSP